MVSSESIVGMVWHAIPLISLVLGTEETWMEEAYVWLFVVKLVGLRGGSFFFTKLSLMILR